MADPSKIIANITFRDEIWWSSTHPPVSYPPGGNQTYIQIENESFWFRHRNACILEAVSQYSPKDSPFLEIGGGNGYVTCALFNAGYDTVMLEPDPAGISNARQRGLKHLICARFEDCTCMEKSAGAVGLFDVLEHIDDDVDFLKRIHPLLYPGGSLFITVPAYPLLWSSEDIHDGHKRRYTMRTINDVLVRAGFSCSYATFFFWPLPGPVFLFRTLPHILRLKRRQTMSTYRRENGMTTPFFSSLITFLLKNEVAMIRRSGSSGFGASILVVAGV